jgi:DNA-binding transcriptional ArsR family regulator
VKSLDAHALPMTRRQAMVAAAFVKRVGHPARIMIACALVGKERSVGELEAMLGLRQPALSQQLAELREAGIVKARRAVRKVFYRLVDDRVVALMATLRQLCAKEMLGSPTIQQAVIPPQAVVSGPLPSTHDASTRALDAACFARITAV